MGDKYARALGAGIRHLSPNEVNLAHNQLSPKGVVSIVKSLDDKLQTLDLSNNKLDLQSAKFLARTLYETSSKLEFKITY
jgi:hypothetical protein